jgi:hypothetical protein
MTFFPSLNKALTFYFAWYLESVVTVVIIAGQEMTREDFKYLNLLSDHTSRSNLLLGGNSTYQKMLLRGNLIGGRSALSQLDLFEGGQYRHLTTACFYFPFPLYYFFLCFWP